MKLAIYTSTFVLLFSTLQANAGAYGFDCTNTDGTIKIGKQYASVNGVKTEYASKSLLSWENETEEKNAVKIEVKGEKSIMLDKDGKTTCGDHKNRLVFAAEIEIRNASNKKIAKDFVLCEQRIENGHCI